jgi:hypothetical protein
MTTQVSTGYKTIDMLTWIAAFTGGHIRVFQGAQPASADMSESGSTLVGYITRFGIPFGIPGYALNFSPAGPAVVNPPFDTWALTPIANGEANWYRLCADPNDDGSTSYNYVRMDGLIGTDADDPNSIDLVLPSTTLAFGTVVAPLSFYYSIPPIVR